MLKPEKIPQEEHWLNAIERRSQELATKIHDKRDAAKYHRETAAAIDEEADWLRHELEVLNFARPQIDVPERRA